MGFFIRLNSSGFMKITFHTVRNLHFLSKNSTLNSRENVLDFLTVGNFDFTKKSWKCWGFVKIEFLEFLNKNLTFRIVCIYYLIIIISKCKEAILWLLLLLLLLLYHRYHWYHWYIGLLDWTCFHNQVITHHLVHQVLIVWNVIVAVVVRLVDLSLIFVFPRSFLPRFVVWIFVIWKSAQCLKIYQKSCG